MNSYVLPLCCSVVPSAVLLCCVVTMFCVQEMKRGTKNRIASIIIEKHCDMSQWKQKAAGLWLILSRFFFSTGMYIKI